jgi:hypothetical protein
MGSMSESQQYYLFYRKVRSWDSTTWLEPKLTSCIFNLLAERLNSFFRGVMNEVF